MGVTSAALAFQTALSATSDGVRSLGRAVTDAPRLYRENAQLRARNADLRAENLRLQDALDAVPEGVALADGVVGRVIEVEPFSSKVLLATDPSSRIPAVVSRGRWWGIAVGTDSRIELRYVSQDAPLKVGDEVITGAGRSFGAGLALGRVARLDRIEGALYQNALVEPAVAFGRLHAVLVLARP